MELTEQQLASIQSLIESTEELAGRIWTDKRAMRNKGYDGKREDFEESAIACARQVRLDLELKTGR